MNDNEGEEQPSEGRLAPWEAARGIGTFQLDLRSRQWDWSPEVAVLFGLTPETAPQAFEPWEQSVFIDDVPKLRAALEAARQGGNYYVEFRTRRADGKFGWVAGRGQLAPAPNSHLLRGTYYDISERKQLEARLLAVNETLEARVADLREEARTLEVLNRTGIAIGAELDLERLVQIVTDAGVELSGAQFGAFFYNVVRPDGEAYTLYTLSGV